MSDVIALRDADALRAMSDSTDLVMARAPDQVLEEARRAARALKDVIEAKKKKIIFNGEQYLEFEDWQTVGRFYGISPRIPESGTKYVEYGSVKGWEAFAEAVDVRSGRLISSAWAMCLDDEEKWCSRPKYDWQYVKKSGGFSTADPGKDELIWEKGDDGKNRPKKERRLVGEERVPLFQLRSMAQTRAASKALRNALAWVVVLAGYRPTPAEELEMPSEPTRGAPAHNGPSSHDGPEAKAPAREHIVATNDPDLISDSEALLPLPESDRVYLIGEIKKLGKGIPAGDKAEAALTYGIGSTLEATDTAALSDLLKWMQARVKK